MKEHPIIFNSEMVRAILDGRKAQTRRVIKMPLGKQEGWNIKILDNYRILITSKDGIVLNTKCGRPSKRMQDKIIHCPYGQPGDELWVRERWCAGISLKDNKTIECAIFFYGDKPDLWGDGIIMKKGYEKTEHWARLWKTKPSIHMPRWASRIQLRVKDVRVERVQQIGMADILAEGIDDEHRLGHTASIEQLRSRFWDLWNSINAKRGYGWGTNPWVWVIEFERKQMSAANDKKLARTEGSAP